MEYGDADGRSARVRVRVRVILRTILARYHLL